jgi:hypothetical protein
MPMLNHRYGRRSGKAYDRAVDVGPITELISALRVR